MSAAAAAPSASAPSAVHKKVVKKNNEAPTELESAIAKALIELESTSKEMSADLRDLFIVSAKELELPSSKRAIVIFVPFRLHKRFQKLQSRLIRELEKKFSGKHVLIVAQRTILSEGYRRSHPGQSRPRSRTLTSVHNAILEDLVYPTAIVGKRIRFRVDGTRLLKVYLDHKDIKEIDYKLKTFQHVYKQITNKNVEFQFPDND